MALLASEVINHMRDMHPAFGPERTPTGVCLRFLTRWQLRFLSTISTIRPEKLAVQTTVSLPLANFSQGAPLPATCDFPQTVTAQRIDDPTQYGQVPVEVVPYDLRLDPVKMPAATVSGPGYLLLLGKPEDWQWYASLTLRYVPNPVAVTQVSTPLSVPDDALDVAVAALAAFAAGRIETDVEPPINLGNLQTEAQVAERSYIETLKEPSGSQVIRIAERW